MTPALILICLYAGLLFLAGLQDVLSRKISNVLSVAVLAVALIALAMGVLSGAWWEHLLAFAITLGAGMFLFTRGWLGGGDVKLLAAAATWFDLRGLAIFLLATAIIGGLIALVMIVLRLTVIRGGLARGGFAGAKQGSVPYGVPIAVAAIALAVRGFPAIS